MKIKKKTDKWLWLVVFLVLINVVFIVTSDLTMFEKGLGIVKTLIGALIIYILPISFRERLKSIKDAY